MRIWVGQIVVATGSPFACPSSLFQAIGFCLLLLVALLRFTQTYFF